jgi:AcrR family transcriptional regulator
MSRSAAPSARRSRRGRLGRPRDKSLPARRREQILVHAIKHFARTGYTNTDLDAVAADIGCAKGTLYNYFRNKRDLFHAAVDHVMRKLMERTAATTSHDLVDQLEDAVRTFLQYFHEHPEYIELLIQERSEFRDRRKPSYFQYREARRRLWRKYYRQLMAQGRIRQMPIERVMDVIGDCCYGTIFMNYFSDRRKTLEQQANDVLDVVFRGVLTETEQRRRAQKNRDVE